MRSLLLHLSYHSHDSCSPLLLSLSPFFLDWYSLRFSASFFFVAVNFGVFVFIPLRLVLSSGLSANGWHMYCKTTLLFILWGFMSFPPEPCWLVHSNVRNDFPPLLGPLLGPLWKNFWREKNSLHVGTLLNMKNYCVIEILFPLSSKQLMIKMKMRSWNPDRGSKIFTFSLYIWLTLTMLYFRIKIEVTILYWSLALVEALSVLSPTLYPPRLLFCEKKVLYVNHQ